MADVLDEKSQEERSAITLSDAYGKFLYHVLRVQLRDGRASQKQIRKSVEETRTDEIDSSLTRRMVARMAHELLHADWKSGAAAKYVISETGRYRIYGEEYIDRPSTAKILMLARDRRESSLVESCIHRSEFESDLVVRLRLEHDVIRERFEWLFKVEYLEHAYGLKGYIKLAPRADREFEYIRRAAQLFSLPDPPAIAMPEATEVVRSTESDEIPAGGDRAHHEHDKTIVAGIPADPVELKAIRDAGPFHHYHVTVRGRERFWLYSILDFSREVTTDALRAVVTFSFTDGEAGTFRFRGDMLGEALLLREDASPGKPVGHVGTFPFFGTSWGASASASKTTSHGMAFHYDWDKGPEFAPCLISRTPVVTGLPEGRVEPGSDQEKKLEVIWAEKMKGTPVNSLTSRATTEDQNELVRLLNARFEGSLSAVIGRLPLAVSYRFKTDSEAFKYLATIYNSDTITPKLLRIRDTHARAETRPLRYGENYLENGQAFAKFLSGGDQEAIRGVFILGEKIDEGYVKSFIGAARLHENKVELWRLSAPILSFIILDYQDDTHEVLFGWGRLGSPWGAGVFVSKDQDLVRAFDHYFEMLKSSAKLVALASLAEPAPRSLLEPFVGSSIARAPEAKDHGVVLTQRWDENEVLEMLKKTPLNADIRIFTSFLTADVDVFSLLLRLLTERVINHLKSSFSELSPV